MNLLDHIRKSYPGLTKRQKKVADYISNNGIDASLASVHELAQMIGVSESSVVRFAQSLGYDGYPPLRRALQAEYRQRAAGAGRIRRTRKALPKQGFVESLYQKDIELIEASLAALSQKDFSRAIDLIWKARRIFIIGFRSSLALAYYLHSRLARLRLDSRLLVITGGTSLLEQLLPMDQRDLLVAIAFEHTPRETLTALHHALDVKAQILSISHSPSSEVARQSTVYLLARRDPQYTQSLTAHMALLNALAMGVTRRHKPRSTRALERLDGMGKQYL
jgi:DNA-binding MurR/RpiR family transcriptional regulator